MSQLAVNEHYPDESSLVAAYADVVNEELRDIKDAGADVVQLDEPYLQAKPDAARHLGVEGIDRALHRIEGPTVVHVCFGYAYAVKDKPSGYSFLPELDACAADQISIEAAEPRLGLDILEHLPSKTIMLGALDLGDESVESIDTVADRVRAGLEHVAPERLVIAPDCGMKYLPRDTAFGKLYAMVEAVRRVRAEL